MNRNKKFAIYSLVTLLTSTSITAFSLSGIAKASEQTQAQLPSSAEHVVEIMMQAMMQMEMMDAEMMEALENAQDFDQEFLHQMTRHHRMATMMAGMVVNSAQHREIRTLAQNIVESQSAEIAQMQQLLQAMNNPN